MEGHGKEIYGHPAHRMFISIDPPYDLFSQSNKRDNENVRQAAGISPEFSLRQLLTLAIARCLEETIINEGPESVAAFIFEPVQGDGGAVPMHPDYFPLARKICDKHGVLMIADEV